MQPSWLTILTLENTVKNADIFIQKALKKEVFIYPTDTIYGIWWIVSPEVISKVSNFKQRKAKMGYSVIAPSFERINEHCAIDNNAQTLWKHYTALTWWGWITLLLPLKKTSSFPLSLVTATKLLWIRIIDHPMQKIIKQLWQPFISTSCNKTGKPPICSLKEISEFEWTLIDWGSLTWWGSAILNWVSGERIR